MILVLYSTIQVLGLGAWEVPGRFSISPRKRNSTGATHTPSLVTLALATLATEVNNNSSAEETDVGSATRTHYSYRSCVSRGATECGVILLGI